MKPTHPGEILREDILPAFNRPKTEIAKMLRISRMTLYDILNERRPVTPQMAHRLGKLCGNGPEIWGRMQLSFDLATMIPDDLDHIPTLITTNKLPIICNKI